MGRAPRVLSSEYQEWAKTRSQARFNLVASGVHPVPLAELGATLDDVELTGPSWYGYPPLQAALAAHCGVPEEQVVAAVGTSLAVHLAMAALVAPGDELLLEHPTYEPILAVARYLGAEVKRFARRPEAGWGIDLDEVARLLSPRTRLIVLSDLHNPSGARLDDAALAGLGELARRAGARVLVDEVYLEMVRVDEGAPARTAARLGPEFVVASSLTKAYGLNGLRCGWVLAEPELARRIWRLT
ncbi:MAG TPA: pyridoxal phosphate-dependent aminotransferase, partial [Thermoanaerobaculia bacterium]